MSGELSLSRYSFLDQNELHSVMRRSDRQGQDDDPAHLVMAANWAVMLMQMKTGRKLAQRNYRDAFTVAGCVTVAASKNVSAPSGLAIVRPGDEVFGAGLALETRVASVTSDVAIVLDTAAEANGTATFTFGTARLTQDGDWSHTLFIPQFPVTTLYSTPTYRSSSTGLETQFDPTNAYLDNRTGRYYMPYQRTPRGVANLLIECQAGYRRPTPLDPGHDEWHALAAIQTRIVQVYFEDLRANKGRSTSMSVGSATSHSPDFKLPADIEMQLSLFMRRWA